MSFKGMEHLAEARIREARERGEFDNLPGQGKPLQLDNLEGLTPEQRIEALLLRSCGEESEETSLLREIRKCRDALKRGPDVAERARLTDELHKKAHRLGDLFSIRRKDLSAERVGKRML